MSEPISQGFTLLEVLVATLLVAIPVAATQMLMLRTAAVVGDICSDAHSRHAANHFVARVSAFHLGGFWPDSSVSPGQWLRGSPAPSHQVIAVSLGRPAASCLTGS